MKLEEIKFSILRGKAAQAAALANRTNCFQNPHWVNAVAIARQRPHEFIAIQADLDQAPAFLFGGLHRRWGLSIFESMPMGGYGGWVSEKPLDNEEQRALSSSWLKQVRWAVVDLTSEPDHSDSLPDLSRLERLFEFFTPCDLQTHLLSLIENDTLLLQRVRSSVRSYLRRVELLGFSFEIGGVDLLPNLKKWYQQGSATWEKKAGVLLPDDFFATQVRGGCADIWVVRNGDQEVGAAFFIKGQFDVLYQASGTQKISAPVSAMDALIWSAARYYRDKGYRSLNLGASEGLDSVRKFKEKFGAIPVSYRRTTYPLPQIVATLSSWFPSKKRAT